MTFGDFQAMAPPPGSLTKTLIWFQYPESGQRNQANFERPPNGRGNGHVGPSAHYYNGMVRVIVFSRLLGGKRRADDAAPSTLRGGSAAAAEDGSSSVPGAGPLIHRDSGSGSGHN